MTRSNAHPISTRPQRRQPTVRARAPEPQMSLLPPARFPARLSRRRSAARSIRSLSEYVTRRPDGLNACRLAGSALEISEQRIVSCFPPAPCTQPYPSASLFPRAFAASDPPCAGLDSLFPSPVVVVILPRWISVRKAARVLVRRWPLEAWLPTSLRDWAGHGAA
jgi:hypothetical protein